MKTLRMVVFGVALGCVAGVECTAADLQAATEDLWAARWKYRYPFVCNDLSTKGDFDRLRDNWRTAGLYDVRNKLVQARDEFIQVVDQTGSPEARRFLGETVNELLCGHLTDGNYLLINALKARYPLPSNSAPDVGRDVNDAWALKGNGSLDDEVVEIDKAVTEFGIGIKLVARILDRWDIVDHPDANSGILRSSYSGAGGASGYPAFAPLDDGFRNPDQGYQIKEPYRTMVMVELNQLTAIAERRAQALFEKGNKYFQASGQKQGDVRAEKRRKAKDALKVGHHSSYLLAAALGSLQSSADFEANKGPRINVFTDQMREFYRNLDNPKFQPSGNTDQFIPPLDKPVSHYINAARGAVLDAIITERTYREQQLANNQRVTELFRFYDEVDEYRDRLARLTGFTQEEIQGSVYGNLLTIDQQRAFRAELERRVGELLSRPYQPGLTYTNLGDFGVQILNVLDAQYRVQQAFNTLQHVPARIQIEQDRSSSVIRIIYDAANQMNATEIALAYASSFSVSASATIGLPPSVSMSVSYNPLSCVVGLLQMVRNNIQANQQAGIEGANSIATVRNILLDMDNAVIELDRAKLLFDQENTKLQLIYADVNKMIHDYSECVALQQNSAALHLDNPEYRRWLNDAYKRAEADRQFAIAKLYELGRVLEYWWTEAYANPPPGSSQALQRFNSANFPELNSVFSISVANQLGDFYLLLAEWNDRLVNIRGTLHQYTSTRSYSLRDQILTRNANVSLNRRIRDFRDYLATHAYYAPGAPLETRPGFRIDFPISLENLDARQDWNLRVGYWNSYPGVPQAVIPGIQVKFEADSGFSDQVDVQVDLTMFGVISTTTFFNDPVLQKPSIIKWEVSPPDSPFTENRDPLAATFPASINGLTRENTSYLSPVFRGRPIAATNWRLTLDTTRQANLMVDISKIRDIKMVITESKGKPTDPDTQQAYVFPSLN